MLRFRLQSYKKTGFFATPILMAVTTTAVSLAQIVELLKGETICHRTMAGIISYVRTRPETFPEWHNSDTAKLFSPPKFENKKENKGYWF